MKTLIALICGTAVGCAGVSGSGLLDKLGVDELLSSGAYRHNEGNQIELVGIGGDLERLSPTTYRIHLHSQGKKEGKVACYFKAPNLPHDLAIVTFKGSKLRLYGTLQVSKDEPELTNVKVRTY